jgi:GNAT superfamily N-acetyltransferase
VAEAATVVIRAVRPEEGERLKEIAIASKAFWGYELDQVKEWADRGDFSPEQLSRLVVFVAEADDREVGWVSLEPRDGPWWLADLWVVPEWIGQGVGARLFRHAAAHARAHGAAQLEWEAEPNSLGFYEKMGAKYLRESKPSEWGRRLSVMGIELPA